MPATPPRHVERAARVHGITLFGPVAPDHSRQAKAGSGFADYETLPTSSEAVIHVASIDNLTKRITDETTLTWRGTY